ncbi:MAG TPA: NADH-quinone oxidoreductase subunit NuoH [Candidatus Anammoximicrobium sp.]|nr:NADH-quinone oxidoreductase subunit NuoH [Candidatus Anammoximicrobium sp.]
MAEFLDTSLHLPTWLAYFLAALVHSALLLGLVATGAAVFIWMERKVAGRIQDRLGPARTGGKFGWLQSPADGLKLLTKEDLVPGNADAMLFRLAPYLSFTSSFTPFLALPFADGWVARHVHTGVFFVLAVLSLEVFGVVLAGYASGSKWSLFGAMRESAQVVSYEIPLKLCVVIPVLLCGTLDLIAIGNMQAGWMTNWLVFHDPFTFIAFWIYFTCGVASVNRAPFDLAEAESELVAGFHTEYSGLRWGFFFMAEYGSMFLVSCLCSVLFFGGWHGPIPVFDLLGWSYGQQETAFRLTGYLANLGGCVNLIVKGVIGVTVMIWVRWTLPRLRIDQVITTCLKYCVPLAAICFVGVLAWQLLGLRGPNDIVPVTRSGVAGVREGWVLKAEAAEGQAELGRTASAAGAPQAVAMREKVGG